MIANSIVLNVLAGKPSQDLETYVYPRISSTENCIHMLTYLYSQLQQAQPSHALLTDIQEKSAFFDTAAAKYSPKVSS